MDSARVRIESGRDGRPGRDEKSPVFDKCFDEMLLFAAILSLISVEIKGI